MTRIPFLLLASCALLLHIPGAAASGSTGWYMHYDSLTDSTSLSRDMPNTAIPLSIPDGGFRVFAEPFAATLTFDASGPWPYSVKLEKAQPQAQTFRIIVGKVGSAPGSPFVEFANVTLPSDRTTFTGTITVPAGSMIHENEKLAFKVHNVVSTKNSGAASKAIQVMVNDPSNPTVTAPQTMMGYPTPELPAVLLVGAGLVGIVALARRVRG